MKIEVKNLSKKFNNFLAVNKINFTIKKNKTLGLLGPNGCGKTTSIGMMLGLIKPTAGQIFINEKFTGERGRVNCSLRDSSGFWRWLGIQFVVSSDN